MRYIRNVHVSLIIGLASVALPITANVGNVPKMVIHQSQEYVSIESTKYHDVHAVKARSLVKTGIVRPQDYYDRRREYWEKRMDRRLEESDEYMDEEDGDNDKADSKNSKDEDDSADSDADREEEALERRREYWQRRLDRDW